MRLAFVLAVVLLLVAVVMVMLSMEEQELATQREPAPATPAENLGGCRADYKATPCTDVGADRSFPAREPLPPFVHRVAPELNPAAKRARVFGTVILDIGIQRDGTVGGVCVVKPLPCGLTDDAVAAVKQWRFMPRTESTVSTVTIHFGRESITF